MFISAMTIAEKYGQSHGTGLADALIAASAEVHDTTQYGQNSADSAPLRLCGLAREPHAMRIIFGCHVSIMIYLKDLCSTPLMANR